MTTSLWHGCGPMPTPPRSRRFRSQLTLLHMFVFTAILQTFLRLPTPHYATSAQCPCKYLFLHRFKNLICDCLLRSAPSHHSASISPHVRGQNGARFKQTMPTVLRGSGDPNQS